MKVVQSGDSSLFAAGWSDKGPLSLLGYQVGSGGELEPFRRKLLDRVFANPIPPINAPNYLDEWDLLSSRGRLRKLIASISSFAVLASGRSGTSLAVNRWQADLEYLRTTYNTRL